MNISTKSQPDPVLDEASIEEYYRQGYLVARELVPVSSIDAVVKEASKIPTVAGGGWTPKIFSHDRSGEDAELHRLLVEPFVVKAVEQILESPARVYYGMVAIVPAMGGKGLAWHQDNMYDVVLGRATSQKIGASSLLSRMAKSPIHQSSLMPSTFQPLSLRSCRERRAFTKFVSKHLIVVHVHHAIAFGGEDQQSQLFQKIGSAH
jgi:hypothetical protein